MKTELMISWRYLVTRRKEKFISLISVISVLGIAIGVMALIVVIAVMSGFDKDLHDKIIGNYAHITLNSYKAMDKNEFEDIFAKIYLNKHVLGVSPYLQGQVLAKEGNRFFAVGLKGIDPALEAKVTKVNDYIVQGSVDNLAPGAIVIGKELANYLGIGLDSNLNLNSASGKQYNMKVVGIFNSGMYDYDLNLVFAHIKSAQAIFEMPNQIGAVAIKLDNPDLADSVKLELLGRLGFSYSFKTWMEANQNFFAALRLEKFTMFIILALIILVASFNIISTLIVMVVEKTKDIGILKALGMSSAGIKRIFTYQGMIIGLLGICLGSLSAIVICALLKKYQFIKLPQDIYYIDSLPVAIKLWPDIALIIISAFIIVLASTIYPAIRASRLKPVEALRYE